MLCAIHIVASVISMEFDFMHAMMSILKHVMYFFAHLEDGSMIGLRMSKAFKDVSIAPQINVITEMAILCNIQWWPKNVKQLC